MPAPGGRRARRLPATTERQAGNADTRLRGRTVAAADAGHCEQVAARWRACTRRRAPSAAGARTAGDLDWFNEQQRRLAPRLSDDERALLRSEIAHQAQAARAWKALPHGTIHADLFRDNVLFDGDRLRRAD